MGSHCPSPEDLPDPGIEFVSLMPPALAGWFFATRAPWEDPYRKQQQQKQNHVTSNPLTVAQPVSILQCQFSPYE